MTSDYGAGKRRRVGPSGPVIAAGAAVLAIVFAVGAWFLHRPEDIRRAQQWAVSGPPCPQVSAQAFQAQPVKIHERFEDNDISFGRGYGHVSCDDIKENGGKGFGSFTECQFTSPGALQVTTSSGDSYFLTKASPATVTVRKSGVGCVLAAKYKGEQSVLGE